VKSVIFPLNQKIQQAETNIDKLYAITDYYRNYYSSIINIGGCPILNVNIDTKNNNERLHQLSKQVAQRLVDDLERIVFEGIENNEISKMINPDIEAKNIYSMIEGSVFMALHMKTQHI
jgi:hypothetical protein